MSPSVARRGLPASLRGSATTLILSLLLVLGAALASPGAAYAATTTQLSNQPFHRATADGDGAVVLPTTSSSTTNMACLTASGNSTVSPVSCAGSHDAVGSGQVAVADGGVVIVRHLFVDAPITSAAGGGLNSTLTVPLPSGGLAPGASVDVAFTFQVDVRGTFWFGDDVDARTSDSAGRRAAASTEAFGTKLSDTQVKKRPARAGLTRAHALTGPDTGRL